MSNEETGGEATGGLNGQLLKSRKASDNEADLETQRAEKEVREDISDRTPFVFLEAELGDLIQIAVDRMIASQRAFLRNASDKSIMLTTPQVITHMVDTIISILVELWGDDHNVLTDDEIKKIACRFSVNEYSRKSLIDYLWDCHMFSSAINSGDEDDE